MSEQGIVTQEEALRTPQKKDIKSCLEEGWWIEVVEGLLGPERHSLGPFRAVPRAMTAPCSVLEWDVLSDSYCSTGTLKTSVDCDVSLRSCHHRNLLCDCPLSTLTKQDLLCVTSQAHLSIW